VQGPGDYPGEAHVQPEAPSLSGIFQQDISDGRFPEQLLLSVLLHSSNIDIVPPHEPQILVVAAMREGQQLEDHYQAKSRSFLPAQSKVMILS